MSCNKINDSDLLRLKTVTKLIGTFPQTSFCRLNDVFMEKFMHIAEVLKTSKIVVKKNIWFYSFGEVRYKLMLYRNKMKTRLAFITIRSIHGT